jgi:hypothetical protein
MIQLRPFLVLGGLLLLSQGVVAQSRVADLPTLEPGRTLAKNALWIENELSGRFNTSKRVVVAEMDGPGTVTMIHFAMPQSHFTTPPGPRLNRDLILRIYWDGEKTPSVECPLVDFFCDPAGMREEIDTVLVNKRRGWNAYFPMPFRKSARIELVYDGSLPPGEELWRQMPCYSYVMYRTQNDVPKDVGYFHASWRQETLLLGQRDYTALDAKGNGKFVGWNVTVRHPGSAGYPVDENEKFFIDGEKTPSVEFQGLEDSFGFSWGFPETQSIFSRTGYFPFLKGACAYRFFLQDAIRFEKSLHVAIGFGAKEDPMFQREFSKPGSRLQLSSTVYWYQVEPHAALPALPSPVDRSPAPDDRFWPNFKENVPSAKSLRDRGAKLEMLCGRPGKEVVFAETGYGAVVRTGDAWDGWDLPLYHCRSSNKEVVIELTVPPNAEGTLRAFVVDPDHFQGGRRETVAVAGKTSELIENFEKGRWIEHRLTRQDTAKGSLLVRVANHANPACNAVVSILEWVEEK